MRERHLTASTLAWFAALIKADETGLFTRDEQWKIVADANKNLETLLKGGTITFKNGKQLSMTGEATLDLVTELNENIIAIVNEAEPLDATVHGYKE